MARERLVPAAGKGPRAAVADARARVGFVSRIGPHLWSTASASLYMYAGRGLGLLWALLLVHEFGVSDYGIYAIAFAVAAMVGLPLDAYFSIRVPRIGDAVFLGERTTRIVMAAVLTVIGIGVWPVSLLAGLAFTKAGTDIAFNAARSHLIRDGLPNLAQRAETSRQLTGVAAGGLLILIDPGATLGSAAALYLAGCTVSVFFAAAKLRFPRPLKPSIDHSTRAILVEALGGVAYVQVDVILLGSLASTTIAGYYSFASLVVWSLAALGQNYGYTFHRTLRASGGSIASGPRFRTAIGLSAITGVFVTSVGLVLLALDEPLQLWLTFVLLGPVSFLRTLSSSASTILVIRSLDSYRMKVTLVSVAVKLVALLILGHFGGVGAAIAFLISDVIMTTAYSRAAFFRDAQATDDSTVGDAT